MKPIILYWRDTTPNPSKVRIILEELGLPYQSSFVELENLRKEPYGSINPNGRVPAILDPNTDITLWETGAIISYLIETYDKDRRITYDSAPEKYLLQQWAFFQASGQGPYFGQGGWFNFYHPEKIESVQKRYGNEIVRVVGVLNRVLEGKKWLVGDKCTYVDLSFVTWNTWIEHILAAGPVEWKPLDYPNFMRWQEAMLARDSLKTVMGSLQAKEVKSEGTL